MQLYTKPASAGNLIGLPNFSRSTFVERHRADTTLPDGLTPGGKTIYRRAPASVAVSNLLAALAGIGSEADHAR